MATPQTPDGALTTLPARLRTLREDLPHRNGKVRYYAGAFARDLLPDAWFRSRLPRVLRRIEDFPEAVATDARARADACFGVSAPFRLPDGSPRIGDLRMGRRQRTYYFDLRSVLRHFDPDLRARWLFGDVREVPEVPTFVKSRPIGAGNGNAVLLKLNRVRHFGWARDRTPFRHKEGRLVGRGGIFQEHRVRFYERYFGHPLCDLGHVGRTPSPGSPRWDRPRMSIERQLGFKFVLALEGNDVASNLKWILSSNSLAVMPTPRFETWFLEGGLQPDLHYVRIREDHADLEERLHYFLAHPEAAEEILRNAHAWVARFRRPEVEEWIGLEVARRYLQASGVDLP